MAEKVYPMEEDWDHLILLDACRYDYFEKIYDDYFEGELKKVLSPASDTEEWINTVFEEKYDDIVYVSANPLINSRGVEGEFQKWKPFKAHEHFYRVIDVWDWGWDKELEMIPPDKVNEATVRAKEKFSNKKLIVHYMQPHTPYYTTTEESNDEGTGFIASLGATIGRFMGRQIRKLIGENLEKIFGRTGTLWRIREILGQRPITAEEVAIRSGNDVLHELYEKNLRHVAVYARELVNYLSGKIVITTDHGELLGENGEYDHRPEYYTPQLVEVPWLELEGGGESREDIEKRRIGKHVVGLKREGKI